MDEKIIMRLLFRFLTDNLALRTIFGALILQFEPDQKKKIEQIALSTAESIDESVLLHLGLPKAVLKTVKADAQADVLKFFEDLKGLGNDGRQN